MRAAGTAGIRRGRGRHRTIVSGEIDISATMDLPVTDYRYICGRIRPDRITKAHEP
jgi:hypothetical protein